MSSDAFEQFAEEFGCWITDHGLTGADDGEVIGGVVKAYVNLPKLESAIHDLIAEAKAQVAADAINQIGHVLAGVGDGRTRIGLTRLRDELAEVAEPDDSLMGPSL